MTNRLAPPAVLRLALWCVSALALGEAAGAQERSGATKRISGVVADREGTPIPFAYVSFVGAGHTVTDGGGRFSSVVPRAQEEVALHVRRIGFRPADTVLAVPGGDRVHTIVLDPIGAVLDPVRVDAVSGYDEYLDRSGYYRRLANRVDGTFFSAADIERRNATEVSAVLRDATGVRVQTAGGRAGKNNYVLGRGGLCALGLVVDGRRIEIKVPPLESFQPRITSIIGGVPVPATQPRRGGAGGVTLDEFVPVSMIGAMEVYPSATSVPSSLQHHVDGCGLIVVWTRYK